MRVAPRGLAALVVAALGATASADPEVAPPAPVSPERSDGADAGQAAGIAGPARPDEVERLQAELATRPDDVDLRLRLALALAWSDRRDDARREARAVLTQAPEYRDAELLLARLAAWDQQWRDARAHLARVLAAAPADPEARLLAVDIALWSGDLPGARSAVAALPPVGVDEVERLYRHALLAAAEGDSRKTLSLAGRILALDPQHAGTRRLRQSVSYLSVESATAVEVYPRAYARRLAASETLTASVFPGARWSASVIYEYRRRFGTHNHRVAVRGDWNPGQRWSLVGLLRVGMVDVVPRLTTLAELRRRVGRGSLGGRYTFDLMPWPGRLHRAHAAAAAPLGRHLWVEADAFAGVLSGCDQLRPVWGAHGRLTHGGTRWELGASAGYGLEVDRGISRAVRENPCAGSTRDLVDVAVAAGALHVQRSLGSRWHVRATYGFEHHPGSIWIHLGGVAVRATH